MVAEWWRQQGLDALIVPGLALPALPHGMSQLLMINCCYTFLTNLLNYPTGSVPITKVREGEDEYELSEGLFKDIFTAPAKKTMKGSLGLPVGIQVCTLPWEDEKCLRVMKEVETAVGFHEYAL